MVVLAAALFMLAGISNAQLKLGVKTGVNLSSFSTESNILNEIKGATNYQFGILLQARVLGFSIQPEVLYSVKGGQLSNVTLDGIVDGTQFDFESQNVEVPVNLQFGFGAGSARVFVQGGPYVSMMTGALINSCKHTYAKVNDYFEFNKMDYGVGLGAGVELLGFQLALKYDFGLNNVGKDQKYLTLENPFYDLKNRNLNISLAYLF